jgi:hypothetical protein
MEGTERAAPAASRRAGKGQRCPERRAVGRPNSLRKRDLNLVFRLPAALEFRSANKPVPGARHSSSDGRARLVGRAGGS